MCRVIRSINRQLQETSQFFSNSPGTKILLVGGFQDYPGPEAKIDDVEIVPGNGRQLLRCVEGWWTIALGSGFRWTIEQLTPKQARRVRADNLLRLREMRATAVETNVLYALARKP